MMKTEWKHGDKSVIASKCKITLQELSKYLNCVRIPRPEMARSIAMKARRMGYKLSTLDLLLPNHYDNRLIKNKRVNYEHQN